MQSFHEEQTMHFSLKIYSNIVPASYPERAGGGVRRTRTRGNIIGGKKKLPMRKFHSAAEQAERMLQLLSESCCIRVAHDYIFST